MLKSVLIALVGAFAGVLLVATAVGQLSNAWLLGLSTTLSLGALVMVVQPWERRMVVGRAVVAAVILGVGYYLGTTVRVFRIGAAQAISWNCLSATKSLGQSLLTYAADNDERFPIAETWRNSIEYPLDERKRCTDSPSPWTSAMNSALSSAARHKVEDPQRTVLLFEAQAYGPNAHGDRHWFAPRHNGRGSIATVDGGARQATAEEFKWTR